MRRHAATQETHDAIVEAMKVEGSCVKTFDGATCGRLCVYDEENDHVYVGGHPGSNPDFTWHGTVVDYFEVWTVD